MRGALLQHISLLRPLSFSRRSTSGWAEVRWDKGGGKNSYRIGADGCCDLEGVDSPNSGVLCPQGHTAHKFKTFHGGFNCDICKKRMSEDTVMYGCRACDWDTCDDCKPSGGSSSSTPIVVAEGVAACNHSFKFHGGDSGSEDEDVKDLCSGLMAKLKGGAVRKPEGLVLDGQKGYAELDAWEVRSGEERSDELCSADVSKILTPIHRCSSEARCLLRFT